jgi:hypothetical protein
MSEDEGLQKAAEARQEAEQQLREVRSRWRTVTEISQVLRRMREDNHFAADARKALKA